MSIIVDTPRRQNKNKVLPYLSHERQGEMLKKMPAEAIYELIKSLDSDDLTDILQQLSTFSQFQVLGSMPMIFELKSKHC